MKTADVAAVVVTFHPEVGVLERLLGYADFLGWVVVVDNSEPAAFAPSSFSSRSNIEYLPLGGNRGVAHGLNVGAQAAQARGYELAVLLDQDSVLKPSELQGALAFASPLNGITALRQFVGRDFPLREPPRAREIDVTMSSGSVLNLRAYRKCGPFEDKLFIDYVDYDYCLRLKELDFRVVECTSAFLDHALGEPKQGHVLGRAVPFVSHRPFRLYYMTRNGLYLLCRHGRRFPLAAVHVLAVLMKEFLKIGFLEPEKRIRLEFIRRGAADWMRGRYGKLELLP